MNKLSLSFNITRKILLNANIKYHYLDKGNRARKVRELAKSTGENLNIKFNKFKITVYVCPPTRRRMDPPNLYPTLKPIIDGLTDAGLWEDDDYTRLIEVSFRYGGLSGVKSEYILKLDIEEVE